MRVNTDGSKQAFILALTTAIMQSKQTIITNIQVGGNNIEKGFVLPRPQTTGTFAQQQAYARVESEKIYTNYFTNRLLESKKSSK